jgi:hypothetical protein
MGHNGTHRGSFGCVLTHMPHIADIIKDSPVFDRIDEYEIDIKVHMLMRGQYPCIPNWHCDNVPRLDTGELKYDAIDGDAEPMYLWVSGAPTTEFLSTGVQIPDVESHGELAEFIEFMGLSTFKIPERTWVQMDQRTPHRGTAATKHCWRIFVRLTHKSLTPARPVHSTLRRHSQVYLPQDFHW